MARRESEQNPGEGGNRTDRVPGTDEPMRQGGEDMRGVADDSDDDFEDDEDLDAEDEDEGEGSF
jgi:hypothetical protein